MIRTVAIVKSMLDLVRRGNLRGFLALAEKAEPADLGDVLSNLDDEQRIEVVRALPPRLSSAALVEMPDESQAEETLETLAEESPETAGEIVDELPDDEAADLVGALDPEDQERILAEVEDRADIEELLRYDPETAGGLMTAQVVTVRATDTAGEAIESLRRQAEEIEDFSQVYVVDEQAHLLGVLPIKRLVTTPATRAVLEIMDDTEVRVAPETDQEEVARVIGRYNVPAVPVVDGAGKLLGQVTFDDVIDVVEAEQTEDLLKFGGTSADEELAAPWHGAVRSRLPWLLTNLVTAFAAGAVASYFSGKVAAVQALIFWMPVIAGMGGNGGTQALAVTVRRVALGLVPVGSAVPIVAKEMAAGLANGAVNGLAAAGVATLLGHGHNLGLVVFLAMTGNLFVAGFAGAFIPLLLHRMGIDPAIASSIFVTTFTDVCGYSLLFGLAGLLLGV
ncbi:MAG TPA: magnesium transporter [Gemmatimonadales bacterium]|nr:magnesium transporter [Gemmatimonadales bacterium]